MTIFSQLDTAGVCLDIAAKNKAALLEALAAEAAARIGRPADEILEALQKREKLGSTALGHGAALPHAQLPGEAPPFVLFARLAQPVDFDARDGEPVDLVVVVLWPAAATKDLLTAMAGIARVLQDSGLRRSLRGAGTAEQVAQLLRQNADAADPDAFLD